jgi:lariat debranching enzyme
MSSAAALTVAVNGCCHGELNVLYDTLQHIETTQGVRTDVLICCGDFEAVRDTNDLECMNVPLKYRKMGAFASYIDGTRVAPVLTLVIGGNHEASNHMQERYHGGWLAPNIYFLGIAGVIRINGVRFAGLSGIFNARSYHKGHFEVPPYSESDIRSVYHVRSFEVFQLAHLADQPLDVFLSHDWPRGIYRFGNANDLFRRKSFLADERDEFGSPANTDLLMALKPNFWFCGHMHVKFAAVVPHSPAAPTTPSELPTPRSTYFLALDKIGPGKQFLQLLQVAPGTPPAAQGTVPVSNTSVTTTTTTNTARTTCMISIDREWLAIVHATRRFFNNTPQRTELPTPEQSAPLLEAARKLVAENIRDEDLLVPPIFMPGMPGVLDLLLMRLQQLESTPTTLVTTAVSATDVVNAEAVELPEFDDE